MSDAAKKITVNRVLLLLVVLTLLAVALPFINYAPNRLVSGEGRQLWEIWPATIWMLTGAGCALFTLCFVPGKRGSVLTLMMAQTLFIVMLWGVGRRRPSWRRRAVRWRVPVWEVDCGWASV